VIIGILAAIAIPAYQDYTVRAKVTEGISIADSAETAVAEGYESNGVPGIKAAGASYATGGAFVATKYVTGVTISTAAASMGVITVTFGGSAPSQITGDQLTFSPSVGGAVISTASAANGTVDWACASSTHLTATAQGVFASPPAGTGVPAKYVPTQCK